MPPSLCVTINYQIRSGTGSHLMTRYNQCQELISTSENVIPSGHVSCLLNASIDLWSCGTVEMGA